MKKLVVFTAQWCGSCKMLKPILAALADENLIDLQIVDVDENRAHAAQMGVKSVPALFFYNDGEVYEQSVGFMPREKVLDIYNREIAVQQELELEVEVVDSLGEDFEVDIVAEVEKEEEVIFTPPHTIFDEQPEEELVVEDEDAEALIKEIEDQLV